MEHGATSNDLLAHFDRPKTLTMPEFDGVDELLSKESAALKDNYFVPATHLAHEEPKPHPTTIRGVRWVLQWAAAGAVLLFAAGVLYQFGCGIAAERQLAFAARA